MSLPTVSTLTARITPDPRPPRTARSRPDGSPRRPSSSRSPRRPCPAVCLRASSPPVPMSKVEGRSSLGLAVHSSAGPRGDAIPSEFRRGFLAGFFDAEGSNSDSLRVSQKNDRDAGTRPTCMPHAKASSLWWNAIGSGPPDAAADRAEATFAGNSWGGLRPAITRKTASAGWEAEGDVRRGVLVGGSGSNRGRSER